MNNEHCESIMWLSVICGLVGISVLCILLLAIYMKIRLFNRYLLEPSAVNPIYHISNNCVNAVPSAPGRSYSQEIQDIDFHPPPLFQGFAATTNIPTTVQCLSFRNTATDNSIDLDPPPPYPGNASIV